MDTFIQEDNLNYIYNTYSPNQHLFQAPPTLHLFVTHYNSFPYLLKCISSIFSQKVSVPFDITLVDDYSDLPEHYIQEFDRWKEMEPLRLRIHRNTSRLSKGINLFKCLEMTPCDPEDVICIFDSEIILLIHSINVFIYLSPKNEY